METINHVASTASKMIWGGNTATNETGGQEPISREQGKGIVTERYDKGSLENPTTGQFQPASSSHGPRSIYTANMPDPRTADATREETFGEGADDHILPSKGTRSSPNATLAGSVGGANLSKPYDDVNENSSSFEPPESSTEPERSTDLPDRTRSNFNHNTADCSAPSSTKPSTTESTTTDPSTASPSTTKASAPNPASLTPVRPEHETNKTGVIDGMGIDGKAEDLRPSEASTNAGGAPEAGATPTQMQQGAGNPMAEPTGKETEGAKKDEGEAVLKKDPNDHSGEPMHMHNGSKPKNQAGGREGKTDNPDGQGHSNEEAGTGERWVKTTGLAAEGGDFDATKPGAGREADRLLEAKGIHKSEPGKPAESRHPDATAGTKERISIGDKIKNKLHIGSKDK